MECGLCVGGRESEEIQMYSERQGYNIFMHTQK